MADTTGVPEDHVPGDWGTAEVFTIKKDSEAEVMGMTLRKDLVAKIVLEGSPAARAGLKVGLKLTAVNGKAVQATKEVAKAIQASGLEYSLTAKPYRPAGSVAPRRSAAYSSEAIATGTYEVTILKGAGADVGFTLSRALEVESLQEGSPAAQCGVVAGSTLLQVDTAIPDTPAAALESLSKASKVLLKLKSPTHLGKGKGYKGKGFKGEKGFKGGEKGFKGDKGRKGYDGPRDSYGGRDGYRGGEYRGDSRDAPRSRDYRGDSRDGRDYGRGDSRDGRGYGRTTGPPPPRQAGGGGGPPHSQQEPPPRYQPSPQRYGGPPPPPGPERHYPYPPPQHPVGGGGGPPPQGQPWRGGGGGGAPVEPFASVVQRRFPGALENSKVMRYYQDADFEAWASKGVHELVEELRACQVEVGLAGPLQNLAKNHFPPPPPVQQQQQQQQPHPGYPSAYDGDRRRGEAPPYHAPPQHHYAPQGAPPPQHHHQQQQPPPRPHSSDRGQGERGGRYGAPPPQQQQPLQANPYALPRNGAGGGAPPPQGQQPLQGGKKGGGPRAGGNVADTFAADFGPEVAAMSMDGYLAKWADAHTRE